MWQWQWLWFVVCIKSVICHRSPAQRQLSCMNVRSSLRPIFLLNGYQTTHVTELTAVTVTVGLHCWVLTFWDGHAEENVPMLCLQTMTNANWWTSSQQFKGCWWNHKLMQVHFCVHQKTLEKHILTCQHHRFDFDYDCSLPLTDCWFWFLINCRLQIDQLNCLIFLIQQRKRLQPCVPKPPRRYSNRPKHSSKTWLLDTWAWLGVWSGDFIVQFLTNWVLIRWCILSCLSFVLDIYSLQSLN